VIVYKQQGMKKEMSQFLNQKLASYSIQSLTRKYHMLASKYHRKKTLANGPFCRVSKKKLMLILMAVPSKSVQVEQNYQNDLVSMFE